MKSSCSSCDAASRERWLRSASTWAATWSRCGAMTASTEPVLAERVPGRRVPDFFIVGQHKSGTTALYEMLRRHLQIYMSDVKEPRFFASDLRGLLQPAPGNAPETLAADLSLFEAA